MFRLPKHNPRRLELIPDALYLGFLSISIQVVYARLAVGFAGGNELYLSLFFFVWLFYSGLGALLIKSAKPTRLFLALSLFAVISAPVLYLTPAITGGIPGQLITPPVYLLSIMIVLLPVCLLNGGLFSSIANSLEGDRRPGRIYWGEALGALTGGIISTLYYFAEGRDYSFLIFIALLGFSRTMAKFRFPKAILFFAAIAVLLTGFGDYIEDTLLKYRYQPSIFHKSVSGRLVRYDTVKTGEQLTLYSGGLKVADFPDRISGQEIFYWPYLIKPDLTNIALVGAETFMVDDLIPPYVKRLYIYPDRTWRGILPPEYLPPEEFCRVADPITFLKNDSHQYDAIILNLGPLMSLYEYRLETSLFLKLCRESLNDSGILSIIVPAFDGIWRDDLRRRLGDISSNLNSIFGEVGFIPGQNLVFIAGEKINIEPARLIGNLSDLQIDSPYFNEAMIRSRLNSYKIEQVTRQLNGPPAYSGNLSIGHGLSYYFSQLGLTFDVKKYVGMLELAIILICLILLAFSFSGFSGSSTLKLANIIFFGLASFIFEILVLYHVQILGGYIYLALGIIIGLFMAGMSGGALYGTYYTNTSKLPKILNKGPDLALLLIILLSGLFLLTPDNEFILLIINTLAGFAGGLGFVSFANRFDSKPGLPYGFDLGGALVGTVAGFGILMATITVNEILFALIGLAAILLATNRGLCKY